MYSIFRHGRGSMTIAIRPSHTCNAGTEYVGFPPTRQTLIAEGRGVALACPVPNTYVFARRE